MLVADGMPVAALPQELDGRSDELVDGVRDRDTHDLGGAQEPGEVLAEVETVELLFLGVPVSPDPLKDACPVVEAVRHDRDLGLADGYEFAVQVGPRAAR